MSAKPSHNHWHRKPSGIFAIVAILLVPCIVQAGGVVTNATETELRSAMAGGGTVTFACDGTITLANTITNTLDTVLDATDHLVTISGGGSVRVFCVQSNVTFVVNRLTIAHGRSTENGAGILNQNGAVNATNTTFYSNQVLGATGPSIAGGSVAGGAVASSGVINLVNCAFTSNSAVGGAGSDSSSIGAAGFAGGSGVGGAIWNSGLVTGNGCTFAANAASGGSGGHGGPASWYSYQPGGAGGAGGDGSGAALFNIGVAHMVNCTLASNTGFGGYGGYGGQGYPYPPYSSSGPNGAPGLGTGGIYNAGQCYLTNCTAVSNSCMGASLARGGVVRNENGEVCLSACIFVGNSASGTLFGNGGASSWGGAVDNSGTMTADVCDFIANSAVGARGFGGGGSSYGAPGGSGGNGKGGAIYNSGTSTVLRSAFTNNSAVGGIGGPGQYGYYGDPGMDGGLGGAGGSGGAGSGGAIYNASTLRVVGATFVFNLGAGANAGTGGDGGGSVYGHGGGGGGGGAGGAGVGALFNSGDARLINSTFADNSGFGGQGGAGGAGATGVFGGNGGSGGGGGSGFGAIFDEVSCRLTNCTIALSAGSSGGGGVGGMAGHGSYQNGNPGGPGSAGSSAGGIRASSSQMVNTLLTVNTPGNCSGAITDLGHNLSSDSSCAFTGPGSRNNTDPKLGPLADNGGPTLTMALLPGSPAIDAGDTSTAPFTDQRGFPRPAGSAADVGACEFGSMLPVLSINRSGASQLSILVQGNANQWCRLLASSNFSDWIPIATNQIAGDGKYLFYESSSSGATCRFYRLAMP